jgi:hypothetical protein
MLAVCGDPETLAVKQRVIDAVLTGEPPSAVASGRHGRTSIRIALRQMKSQGYASTALDTWLASFDPGSPNEQNEDADLHEHD